MCHPQVFSCKPPAVTYMEACQDDTAHVAPPRHGVPPQVDMPGPDAATVTSDVFLGLLPAELTGKPSMERFAVRPVRMLVDTCTAHKRLTCVHAERCQPFIAHLCWEANGVGSRVAATISQEIKAGEYVSTLKPLFRGALYPLPLAWWARSSCVVCLRVW